MPSAIRKLSDEIIGKIAAGEVVERPAAAIKELVENSLDAGASAVTVEIRDGGITYIRVTDNGSGIPTRDIRMAFERHATSKISGEKDLAAIDTLGFRGEALASIAAVSRVTCTTRTADEDTGIKVVNEGGQILSIDESACAQGTTFIVRDLFSNVPVRLKFLKKPVTEAGYVTDLMMRLILSRPDISFRLINQGKTVYRSAGDGKLSSAVFEVYGSEMLKSMREVKGNQGGILLNGYVGIGESGRGNRANQSFFINGRYTRSSLLSTAVEEACRERVMIGKFPTCVLHLTMPYEAVDVNVHPNKLEVRFQNERGVAEAVETLIREALQDRDAFEHPVPMSLVSEPSKPSIPVRVEASAEPLARQQQDLAVKSEQSTVSKPTPVLFEHSEPRAPIGGTAILRTQQADSFVRMPTLPQPAIPLMSKEPVPDADADASIRQDKAQPLNVQEQSFLPDEKPPMHIIGVAMNTYILVEYADHLMIIDQHAVHERLLYERMMKAYDTQQAGQELLVPLIVPVTRREIQTLNENEELLKRIGFEIELFGEHELAVRAIPMILGQPQTAAYLHEVLDQLSSERLSFSLERRRSQILQTACKHAVKGGEDLSEADVRSLVEQMIEQKVTPTCPHGRPLVVSISRTELERKFKRIQD